MASSHEACGFAPALNFGRRLRLFGLRHQDKGGEACAWFDGARGWRTQLCYLMEMLKNAYAALRLSASANSLSVTSMFSLIF
jgi:hypothetical protein